MHTIPFLTIDNLASFKFIKTISSVVPYGQKNMVQDLCRCSMEEGVMLKPPNGLNV